MNIFQNRLGGRRIEASLGNMDLMRTNSNEAEFHLLRDMLTGLDQICCSCPNMKHESILDPTWSICRHVVYCDLARSGRVQILPIPIGASVTSQGNSDQIISTSTIVKDAIVCPDGIVVSKDPNAPVAMSSDQYVLNIFHDSERKRKDEVIRRKLAEPPLSAEEERILGDLPLTEDTPHTNMSEAW